VVSRARTSFSTAGTLSASVYLMCSCAQNRDVSSECGDLEMLALGFRAILLWQRFNNCHNNLRQQGVASSTLLFVRCPHHRRRLYGRALNMSEVGITWQRTTDNTQQNGRESTTNLAAFAACAVAAAFRRLYGCALNMSGVGVTCANGGCFYSM
jgi:hypothetical protein